MEEKEKIFIKEGEGDAVSVIDMEKDFVDEDGALHVAGIEGEPSMDEVVDNTEKILGLPFDHKAASQDSHPEGHIEFGLFGKHCPAGEPGEQFCDRLKGLLRADGVELIVKGMDKAVVSYTVMTSHVFAGHITTLRKKGIKRVFLVGLALNYCVIESAVAYALQGFEVFIVRDATRSVPPPYGAGPEVINMKMKAYGIRYIDRDQLISA